MAHVSWFEIIGKDAIGLQKFYADTFGWQLTPPAPDMANYSMLQNAGKGIGGGIGEDDKNRVTIYIEVDDPQAYLDKATKAGATTLMPITNIMEGVTIGLFADPAGNTIGLMKPMAMPQA